MIDAIGKSCTNHHICPCLDIRLKSAEWGQETAYNAWLEKRDEVIKLKAELEKREAERVRVGQLEAKLLDRDLQIAGYKMEAKQLRAASDKQAALKAEVERLTIALSVANSNAERVSVNPTLEEYHRVIDEREQLRKALHNIYDVLREVKL